MCSILGLIDFDSRDSEKKSKIFNLNKSLTHRGPDDEGYYNDECVSLAFNRLSIIDLNNGNQPQKKNNIISIFNGEIYNFKEIKEELTSIGYKFNTNSDSEIIPNAFLAWGIKCIEKFNGMFSIAIYDLDKKKIFIIRDRVGIKPLFFSKFNDYFLFSSEIKGIINFPGFQKELNLNALSSYLSFRYPMGDENTFFKNIEKVSPGSYLEIDIKKKLIKKNFYWRLPAINSNTNFSEKYYDEKLENLLEDSVKKQLISDVPLGVFLSGGLDSSILASIAAKNIPDKLKTYSVGFSEKKYDETSKARLISNFIGSEHQEVLVNKKDFFNNLESIIKIKDTPLSIPHEFPMYLLSKRMKQDITVVLSGEGADEFFGGYSRVQNSAFDFLKGKFFSKFSGKHFFNKIFSIDEKFDFKNKNYLDYFFHVYKWFSFNEKEKLFSNDIINKLDNDKIKEPWKQVVETYKDNNFHDQTLLMFQKNHLQCLLDRLDIMTMANSIEARVPFLDHRLIEFINTVPFEYKIRWKSKINKFKSLFSNNFKFSEKYDTNKYLLRKLGKKYLPQSTAVEKKLGFPLPMNNWMNDNRIKEILLDKQTLSRNIFNKDSLEKLFIKNKNSNDPYDFDGKKIWMMVNFELWMRSNFN